MKLGLPFSITVMFWSIVGAIRYLYEKNIARKKKIAHSVILKRLAKVAICIPAHNEERTIEKTIRSVKRIAGVWQIFVVSDGSTDKTAEIVRGLGPNVLEIYPGKGKAGALDELLKHFNILDRFDFVLFVDADVTINSNFLLRALRVFEIESETVAIAGYAINIWRSHKRLTKKNFIKAYRYRLSYLWQMFLVYGYSWKPMNGVIVIPGSCSIYRTSVLKKIHLNTPGILIEDFNLAFQIQKRRLGSIAHYPDIYSFDIEPSTIQDYWNQVKRWNIGFLQTVRKHGMWPSLFWLSTGLFTMEVWISAIFMIALAITVPTLTAAIFMELMKTRMLVVYSQLWRYTVITWQLLGTAFLVDYTMTIITMAKRKSPLIAIYGLGFLFFRVLDAMILIASVPQGLFSSSSGRWTPPKRA